MNKVVPTVKEVNLEANKKEIKFSRPIFDSVDTISKECYGGFRSETNLDD